MTPITKKTSKAEVTTPTTIGVLLASPGSEIKQSYTYKHRKPMGQ
jgi:hypothetical protein